MNFKFKLSRRLARMKLSVLIPGILALACKVADAGPEVVRIQRIEITPTHLGLRPSQSAGLSIGVFTSRGDSVPSSLLLWSTTGGFITSNSIEGSVRHVTYQLPAQPGEYLFIVTTTSGWPSDTAHIAVTNEAVPVYAVAVAPGSVSLAPEDTTTLRATLTDSSGNVIVGRAIEWTSSDAGVATVLATGLVRAIAAGTATITATSEGRSGTAVVTVVH